MVRFTVSQHMLVNQNAVYFVRTCCILLVCVAWRFWLGALSNKGGRGQRNREEIGAGVIFLTASPLVLARLAREFRGYAAKNAPLDKTAMLRRLVSSMQAI